MKTILFLLLSLALLSCQGGKKQNVQSADTVKEDEFIASVLYTAPPYYVIGKDTIYNYATDPIFPVHTSDPENPLLSIDLKNYVQKKLADVHFRKAGRAESHGVRLLLLDGTGCFVALLCLVSAARQAEQAQEHS